MGGTCQEQNRQTLVRSSLGVGWVLHFTQGIWLGWRRLSLERACTPTTITRTHRRTSTYLSFICHISRCPAQCNTHYDIFFHFSYVFVLQNTCYFPVHNSCVYLSFFGLRPLCLMFNWAGPFGFVLHLSELTALYGVIGIGHYLRHAASDRRCSNCNTMMHHTAGR